MDHSETLGAVIRAQRTAGGLDIQRLAKASGLTYSELDKIERGELMPAAYVVASVFRNISEMGGDAGGWRPTGPG